MPCSRSRPHAWRREPYYSTFKKWAVKAAAQRPHMHLIDVMHRDRVTVILPDRDVEIGAVADDETIEVLALGDGKLDARIIKRRAEEAPAA